MTITELFNLSPEQTARANDTLAAIRVAIESFRQALEPVAAKVAQLKLSPDALEQLQRCGARARDTMLQLAEYFRPYTDALNKLVQDPEWRAMLDSAAKMNLEPQHYFVPTVRVPLRGGPSDYDEPLEVPPHRRTGFKLPGVNDE